MDVSERSSVRPHSFVWVVIYLLSPASWYRYFFGLIKPWVFSPACADFRRRRTSRSPVYPSPSISNCCSHTIRRPGHLSLHSYLFRQLSRRSKLYTEMYVDQTLLHQQGNLHNFLSNRAEDGPVAVQVCCGLILLSLPWCLL